MLPTRRLYWEDDHCHEFEAQVVGIGLREIALDATCFYAGGGGQPSDTGTLGERWTVTGMRLDEADVLWHQVAEDVPESLLGQRVNGRLDVARRVALARYHTVLHVLNTIALREYDAWITGAQIGTDYSRIDFKIEKFSPEVVKQLEDAVNAVLAADHTLRAFYLEEAEFAQRADLLRTLEVKPPVRDGRVRVVAIEGFDEQACGGTHVHSTHELGRMVIFKTENKGKINKRLYVRLDLG